MPNQTISILRIEANKLILSDEGRTEVKNGWKYRKVTWEIEDAVIKSFRIVGKQPCVPFKESIPVSYGTKVKLTVRKHEPPVDWEYSIHWIDNDGNNHIHDPIISIKPSTSNNLVKLLIALVTIILGFFSFKLLQKKMNRK